MVIRSGSMRGWAVNERILRSSLKKGISLESVFVWGIGRGLGVYSRCQE